MDIPVTRRTPPKEIPANAGKGFGAVFTDHMFVMDYTEEAGWHDHRIVPFGPIPIHPSASALQYGQSMFDGFKAYRCGDGVVRLFRPRDHLDRIDKSARRLCMPPIDHDDVLDAMVKLVGLDARWVPQGEGSALYVRETMIGSEGFMAVRPAKTYTFLIFLSPVGNYFAEGMNPVGILVSDTHVRAARGGIGSAKAAANYAASLLATEEAKDAGFAQVLWLDSMERRWIEEVGTMNVMLRVGDEIVTPPLGDSILPGVTRLTALHLLREWGLRVSERPISIDEVMAGIENGTIPEIWGLGTAAVVAPIGALTYRGKTVSVGEASNGPTIARLRAAITDLHTRAGVDPYGWRVDVPETVEA